MNYDRKLCDRVGKDYREAIGQAVGILKHLGITVHPIANIIADELDKLYLGIETGELEIIKFGRPMTEGEIEMIREAEKKKKKVEDIIKSIDETQLDTLYDLIKAGLVEKVNK